MEQNLMHQTSQNPGLSRRFSRRSFLGGSAAGILALTGCSVGRSGGQEFDIGSSSNLRVLNWADYIDPELISGGGLQGAANIANFEYSEGYDGNAEIWDTVIAPNLSNGNPTSWDIMMPTYWQAARMIENGWVEPLPIELIPNHANLDSAYMTLDWDRGARLQMPWQAGITGIAFDTRVINASELTSVAQFLEADFPGQIGMIGEMREALGLIMLAQGEDPSRPTVATAEAALDLLEELNNRGRFNWVFNEFAEQLSDGQVTASMAWSGDTVLLQDELAAGGREGEVEFIIPDEGAIQWFDTMVIPKGSPNVAAAGSFMNAVYDPVMAANITQWVQYISPVIGVRDELLARRDSAALATNPILFPDDTTRRRLFTWGQLPTSDEVNLEERFNAIAGL